MKSKLLSFVLPFAALFAGTAALPFAPLATAQDEANDTGHQPAAAARPPTCREAPGFRRLDFWVGRWDVFDAASGKKVGENVIESVLKGCAIYENWTGGDGSEGKSWFYRLPATGVWKQIWVTEMAARRGGVKEKQLVADYPGPGVRFRGRIALKDGGSYLDQTTLEPLDDGRVRQIIEISTDGGRNWQTIFDAFYQRQGAEPGAPAE